MLGLRDHLISPCRTGYESTGIESIYPNNTDIFRKAKAQHTTIGYAHEWWGDDDPLEGLKDLPLWGAKGFMIDAALGTTDVAEWIIAGRRGFYLLTAVMNNGLAIPATGGSDSMSDMHSSRFVGSMRTYVYIGDRGPGH